jgi:hypothetical protein
MLTSSFLCDFKRRTEERWARTSIRSDVYGFQFQPGTYWNPGLADNEIVDYERHLGTEFPHEFKRFLRVMNGTNLPTLNVYGNCGEPPRQAVGVYSYPRDLDIIEARIVELNKIRDEITVTLADQGFTLAAEANFIPIYGIRVVLCTSDSELCRVLSILDGDDSIVYANSLQEYLEKEFLRD